MLIWPIFRIFRMPIFALLITNSISKLSSYGPYFFNQRRQLHWEQLLKIASFDRFKVAIFIMLVTLYYVPVQRER